MEPHGAELLDRVAGWWDQNQRILLGALAAVALIGGGSFLYFKSQATQEDQASGKLAEASVMFWQGDYARSLEIAKQVYTQYGSTPTGNDAHRLAGDNAFWSGDFKAAVTEYRRFLDKAKPGLLADAARRSLAYALESNGQALEAAKVYDELVGRFDRTSSAEFLVASARCFRTAGQPAEAIKRLERVDAEFGDTYYAQQARIDLGALKVAAAP